MSVRKLIVLIGAAALAVATAFGWTISHEPVPFAVRGQPLTLRAKVEGIAEPQSVTLYYQIIKDAAPFRVPMKSTGLGYYVGAIEANLLVGVESLSYYIEAQAEDGTIVETPWYTVKIREPRPSERAPVVAPPAPAPAGPAPAIPLPEEQEKSSWRKPVLIGAGALAVAGGVYALASDSGGGGGGGESDPSTNAPGNYAGTVILCATPAGSSQSTCDTRPFQLLIDSRNTVFTDSLAPGQQLTGSLENNRFTLTSQVNGGTIYYNGTWANNTIVGQISGSATSTAGTVVYSGTFSANKL